MRAPRLVATDLDGTLLRSDGTVSELTRRVLLAVEAAGVPVVFVTARPLRWMDELWSMVGAHSLAVVSNGAVLYDVAAREVRELRALDPGPGLELAAAVRAAVPSAQIAVECLSGIRLDPTYDEPHHVPPGSPVGPLEQVWDEPAVKVLVRAPDVDPVLLQTLVVAAVGTRGVATWSVAGLVEISAPGVTKAAALARVCAGLDVAAEDVLAFGDMPNDLPMLAWAGTACAVGNAEASVRAAAHEVVPTNDEDGVARTLCRLVPGAGDLL